MLLTYDTLHTSSSVWVVALWVSDHSQISCTALKTKSLSTITHHILQVDRAVPGFKV